MTTKNTVVFLQNKKNVGVRIVHIKEQQVVLCKYTVNASDSYQEIMFVPVFPYTLGFIILKPKYVLFIECVKAVCCVHFHVYISLYF